MLYLCRDCPQNFLYCFELPLACLRERILSAERSLVGRCLKVLFKKQFGWGILNNCVSRSSLARKGKVQGDQEQQLHLQRTYLIICEWFRMIYRQLGMHCLPPEIAREPCKDSNFKLNMCLVYMLTCFMLYLLFVIEIICGE